MNFLPVVLGLTLLLPTLRHMFQGIASQRTWAGRTRFALDMAALIVMTAGTHFAFKHYYGNLMGCDPAYMRSEAQMRLGLVAPLVRPEHLRKAGLSPELLDRVSFPLSDPLMREAQMWMPGGLWQILEQEVGHKQALSLARKISARALQSDPFGLVRMGFSTSAGYFDSAIAKVRMADDLGSRKPSEHAREMLLAALNVDRLPETNEGAGYWFGGARWWLTLVWLLNGPLAVILLWRSRLVRTERAAMHVVALASLGLVMSHFLFSHVVSFRYLHSMPALFIVGSVMVYLASRRPQGAQ